MHPQNTDPANDNALASPPGNAAPQTFRIVIEDEASGYEHRGWRALSHARIKAIAAWIDAHGCVDEENKIGRLPPANPNILFGSRARGRR